MVYVGQHEGRSRGELSVAKRVWGGSRARLGTAVLIAAAMVLALQVPSTAAHASGTTYYVDAAGGSDSNPGTISSPWATLNRVNTTAFPAGASVLFRGGQTWSGNLTVSLAGTNGSPAILGSYGGGRARINGARSSTATVTVTNPAWVTIRDLEITNTTDITTPASRCYRGLYVEAKDTGQRPGLRIENNFIHDIDGLANNQCIANGGITVGVRGNSTPTWFSGAVISGNEVARSNNYGISTYTTWCAGCTTYPDESGVPLSEVSSQRYPFTRLTIEDNYVHDVTSGGITPQYADDSVVQYNTVDRAASNRLRPGGGNVAIWWQGTHRLSVQYNVVRRTSHDGIFPGADSTAFDADMDSVDSVVQHNITSENAGGFILCIQNSKNLVVRGNLSMADTERHLSFWQTCTDSRVYNNTFAVTDGQTPVRTSVSGAPTDHPNDAIVGTKAGYLGTLIYNNVFYNPARVPLDGPVWEQNVRYDHNLYWSGAAATTEVPSGDQSAVVADPELTLPVLPAGGQISRADVRTYLLTATTGTATKSRGISVPATLNASDGSAVAPGRGATDLGVVQAPVALVASTDAGTHAGSISQLVDADPATSWSSKLSPTLPSSITITSSSPRAFDAVDLSVAFGAGQGPTSVTVQALVGGAWTTIATAVPVAWALNGATVETRRIPVSRVIAATAIRVTVNAANLQWGQYALNEISLVNAEAVATTFPEQSPSTSAAYAVDKDPATSWSSRANGPTTGELVIDSLPRTVGAIDLSVAFGQGQGPTNISVDALTSDGAWVRVVNGASISWGSSTAVVETRTVLFEQPVASTRFRVVVHQANTVWGNVALNEISLR